MKKFNDAQFDRESVKVRGFKRHLASWKYSMQGLAYAYKYEQSVLIHFVCTIIAVIGGILLDISLSEWLLIFISLGSVLAIELINTAIEATVDLVTTKIHPLAKIAKDCGSAATFVCGLIATVISLGIFIPKLIEFIR